MKNILGVVSMAVLLSACGGSGSQTSDNVSGGETSTALLGAAFPDSVDTNTLVVDRDFGFKTSRTIDISFDIEDARTEDATVSICTEYKTVDDDFDINFDSCTVNGVLQSGVFEHSMEVTIDKTSVVAAVFFQNAQIAPLFSEFSVNESLRTKGYGQTQTIVWHQL